MVTTCLLIDLENRQPPPEHVAAWMGEAGEAWIFYGEQQINLLPNYFQLGERVSVVPISRPGKNSLDFHLVLYLGYLVAKRKKGARFVVVAADADYDAAIAHARGEGIDVARVSELPMKTPVNGQAIAGPPASIATKRAVRQPKASKTTKAPTRIKTTSAIYAGILKDIQGPNRPGDLKALTSRIQSRIGPENEPAKVAKVMARLETMDVVKVVAGDLVYLSNAR